MKRVLAVVTFFIVGIAVGGWLFSRTIPRSFLAVSTCGQGCFSSNEIAGLLTSIGIQRIGTLLPAAGESGECIAVHHPRPQARVHILLFPKRDARNVLELQAEDVPYVVGCFALARELVKRDGLHNYQLYTNGPALQHVNYLHFHLVVR